MSYQVADFTYKDFATIRRDEIAILHELESRFPLTTGGKSPIDSSKPLSVSRNNQFQEVKGMINTLSKEQVDDFRVIYNIEDRTLGNKNPKMLVLYRDGKYQGALTYWENDEYVSMTAIRTSISNALLGVEGSEEALIYEIMNIAEDRTILTYLPFDSIEPLLYDIGFRPPTIENIEERSFMSPFDNVGIYKDYLRY